MSTHVRLASWLALIAVATMTSVLLIGTTGHAADECRAKNQAVARLKTAEGDDVGKVTFGLHGTCYLKIAVALTGLSDGFHGFHIHETGVCDPDAADEDGNPSPFYTAGGHWNATGNDAPHPTHQGDLSPVLVMSNGAVRSWFLTTKFLRVRELFDQDGSAVIVHASADNLGNIPATTSSGSERFHSHVSDTFGPDEETRKTGDSGARFACGVVERIKG